MSAFGHWIGCAEVYDGRGRFLGNGTDTRHVQPMEDGRTRIDVSFVGPLRAAGHYFVLDQGDHRLYQGPVNVGYAETLAENLIDANAYWASVGLSQRFFLMTLPDMQLSLALMSRGEELVYVIVGENRRADAALSQPVFENATSYDLGSDPTAGRGVILLHRAGRWMGDLHILDAERPPQKSPPYCEQINADLSVETSGGFAESTQQFQLQTNGWQAWTPPGNVVGSCSLSGGRALSGQFHYLDSALRVWRREVVSSDGTRKAVLNVWYRGGERIGVEYGLLTFEGDRHE